MTFSQSMNVRPIPTCPPLLQDMMGEKTKVHTDTFNSLEIKLPVEALTLYFPIANTEPLFIFGFMLGLPNPYP